MSEPISEVITYDSYLKVPTLLSCQKTKSDAPTEVLFILVHQGFELWFKQVLRDMDSIVIKLQNGGDTALLSMNKEMERIVMIFKLVIQNFAILETMSPMEFMDFRGFLSPASGFQSLQFRLIEIKLGMKDEGRAQCDGKDYKCSFSQEQRADMQTALKSKTLLQALEIWLEKTPGLKVEDFVIQFRQGAQRWHVDTGRDYDKSGFEDILDETKYNQGLSTGFRRLSWRAFLGALMIFVNREQPAYSQRCTFLQRLMDLENQVFQWRCNHVMMVHRMIGQKTGTGGSSGVGYLRETVTSDSYRVFKDLFNMATYLLPSEFAPRLSE